MKARVWATDGTERIVQVTPGENGALAISAAPADGTRPTDGLAGISIIEDPEGWLDSGLSPIGHLLYSGPSSAELLMRHLAQGLVDEHAPTQAAGSIAIDADPRLVYEILADVHQWPRIRGDIADVETSEPLEPGSTFSWTSGANRFTSTFGPMEAGRRLTWISTAPGVRVTHVYRFEELPSGGTVVECAESLAAPLISGLVTSAILQSGVDSWLQGLKTLAEWTSRAAAG
jgi:hypothetical protein